MENLSFDSPNVNSSVDKNEMLPFSVGDIVTLKTHQLLHGLYIKGDGKFVPPLMIIKEVLFETKQKRIVDEMTGYVISEKVKYVCVHFDDNKGEFIESHHYHSMVDTFKKLQIASHGETGDNHIKLIDEVSNYPLKAEYKYGIILYFKTKKLEVFKKRLSHKIVINEDGMMEKKKPVIQYVVNYSTPDFVICGYKKESPTDLFYNDGKPKKKVSFEYVKVKWFNSLQQKFSEQYLPLEFFINDDPFNNVL